MYDFSGYFNLLFGLVLLIKKIIVNIEGDGNECNTISRKQTTKSSDPEQTVQFRACKLPATF